MRQQAGLDQSGPYDLLAVFRDEATADAAAAKLRKEGYGEDEVFQLAVGSVGQGEFRQHGPDVNRRNLFLETRRTGPNPAVVVSLAVILGLIVGGGTFEAGVLHLALLAEPSSALGGGVLGAIIGAVIGLLQRGRVRGDIGQTTTTTPSRGPAQGAHTVVALRLADPDDIRRRSRAQAMLINSGGKIDKSVGRTV
ncbi:MAG: hypothetical protein JO183_07545 [Ktedonobacteraceae bacterium]|nr:hypothetical protein [Ktedonobacteraceae bacterium]MBV9022145.1 hypothetical protein [Ktedonobacteraceae bacterium]